MMKIVIVVLASLVGVYLGYMLDNTFNLGSPTGGFDMSDAVVAASAAACMLLAMHLF